MQHDDVLSLPFSSLSAVVSFVVGGPTELSRSTDEPDSVSAAEPEPVSAAEPEPELEDWGAGSFAGSDVCAGAAAPSPESARSSRNASVCINKQGTVYGK